MRESFYDFIFEYIFQELPQIEPAGDGAPDRLALLPDGRVGGAYRGLTLYSVFQPIFAVEEGSAQCFEALLRAQNDTGGRVSPERVFSLPGGPDEHVYLDRVARIMHAMNFMIQSGIFRGKLFLNIDPCHLTAVTNSHGEFFEKVLQLCGFSPKNIVLEILESAVDDTRQLQNAVANYRKLGFGIAIDDFGRDHSNFERLWRLEPDIVKLDRSLIAMAVQNQRMRNVLRYIVEIIHQLHAKVVCEGIETSDQVSAAQDAGVDFLQGYYFAKPSPNLQRTRLFPSDASMDSAIPACERLYGSEMAKLAEWGMAQPAYL
ncbi:EAL domain-containing protein [Methylogaea oryzae]|uniref:EAL domain-containing protein n=1 Tax=Methylogaea oryzae TaxID=1295382 RepID=A0A8D4VNU2_9GAMM|nr:EAL domain-containing protein [Methylogaea oryzae]BBL70487.1 hypothetical protein MoryE10_10930 [Methylogaea oryzae]